MVAVEPNAQNAWTVGVAGTHTHTIFPAHNGDPRLLFCKSARAGRFSCAKCNACVMYLLCQCSRWSCCALAEYFVLIQGRHVSLQAGRAWVEQDRVNDCPFSHLIRQHGGHVLNVWYKPTRACLRGERAKEDRTRRCLVLRFLSHFFLRFQKGLTNWVSCLWGGGFLKHSEPNRYGDWALRVEWFWWTLGRGAIGFWSTSFAGCSKL